MAAPDNDAAARRVEVLTAYEMLDTNREREFDDIAALAAALCDVPMAVINLLDAERQWFKAEVGFGIRETPISESICVRAIESSGFVEIEDTRLDPRSADNKFVVGAPYLRFYAGAILSSPAGVAFGTLCVLDLKPRRLTSLQRDALRVLARQIMKEFDLRLALRRQDLLQREMDHRVKNSLQSVASFVRVQAARSHDDETRDVLAAVGRRISSVALLHQELYSSSEGEDVALESYMAKIAGLFSGTAPDGVTVEVSFSPAVVTSEQATALAAIANEFVTNAYKHAFPDGRRGLVTICGRPAGEGTIEVTMRDNGVGVGTDGKPRGLGIRIIEASAQQMGGTLAFDTIRGSGFGLTLTLPVVRPSASFGDGAAAAQRFDGKAATVAVGRNGRQQRN